MNEHKAQLITKADMGQVVMENYDGETLLCYMRMSPKAAEDLSMKLLLAAAEAREQ